MSARDDAIDAYFAALDEEDPSLVEPVLADSFVYETSGGNRLSGFAGFEEYMTVHRGLSNTTHTEQNRLHGDEVSFTEGVVTGSDGEGGSIEMNFCDVFEFNTDNKIIRAAVYLNG
jgi:ketosteroid isomerase-like protein